MPNYCYEVRHGEQVVATGHLSHEQPLAIGEPITLGSESGIVHSIEPVLHQHELRVVVQLWRDDLVGD